MRDQYYYYTIKSTKQKFLSLTDQLLIIQMWHIPYALTKGIYRSKKENQEPKELAGRKRKQKSFLRNPHRSDKQLESIRPASTHSQMANGKTASKQTNRQTQKHIHSRPKVSGPQSESESLALKAPASVQHQHQHTASVKSKSASPNPQSSIPTGPTGLTFECCSTD